MATSAPTPVLEAHHISRTFGEGQGSVMAVSDVSCQICSDEFVGLVGPSGCGKSSLLNIFGLVEVPSSGTLRVRGVDATSCPEHAREAMRRNDIGYVFQAFNLLSTLSVLENVMLPCLFIGQNRELARERASELLSDLGLLKRAAMYPATLSGGEMQRVAIARAVSHRPAIILADEPTGNLDSGTGATVLSLLREVHRSGTPIVMATHSDVAMANCTRVLRMRDGALRSE
jgi:putative ABC transport system ATP-binding protein